MNVFVDFSPLVSLFS